MAERAGCCAARLGLVSLTPPPSRPSPPLLHRASSTRLRDLAEIAGEIAGAPRSLDEIRRPDGEGPVVAVL